MAEHDYDPPGPFPRTVEAAVELVLARLSDDLRAWLRRFPGDEAALRVKLATGITPGMNVRAMLGLWGQNRELLAQLPRAYQHPESASSYFLIECWKRLRGQGNEPGAEKAEKSRKGDIVNGCSWRFYQQFLVFLAVGAAFFREY